MSALRVERRMEMRNLRVLARIGSGVLAALLWATALPGLTAEIPRIQPDELKKMIESGDPSFVVVDAQPKSVYDLGHIPGAVNFPWAREIKGPINLPQSKTLILYCDCGQEEDSIDLASQLMENWEYMNIKVLEGGWSRWKKLGYPIEKSK
jgi:rhodanese-related sulfurtransferase